MNITYTQAKTVNELHQILALQAANLSKNISEEEAKNQGFVTVQHDFELLDTMNQPFAHIIAKDGERVVGYALVMLRSFADKIPVLFSMFDMINKAIFQEKPIKDSTYFTMGQICIDKDYRGQGLVENLYKTMEKYYAKDFQYLITEISARNTRSIKAHSKVGFENLKVFTDETSGEVWHLVIWDWNKS
jgi:ribosomal protein S18 acetylase RimI-like enzyme